MVPIQQFDIELTMTLKTQYHLNGNEESLSKSPNTIKLDRLIDDTTRVTFISGIPGSGKSVLSKQIVNAWANRKLYRNFELCLYFECSELNKHFVCDPRRKELCSQKESLQEFINKKLDGLSSKNLLIVIDGVDELHDVSCEKSVIHQFLDIKQGYGSSKVIITGRPHTISVLSKLMIDSGGYKILEINELDDQSIRNCISKFFTHYKERESICSTITSLGNIRPLLRVAQFLHGICCIFISNGRGEPRNEAEIYTWTLYLYLKQHFFEREKINDKRLASTVFERYSKTILYISEIAFDVYSKGTVVFKKEEYRYFFGTYYKEEASDGERRIIDSIFTDASDNRKDLRQFLPVMFLEYLSAIHVYNISNEGNQNATIGRLLSTELFGSVRLACALYGGVCEDGIIRDLLVCLEKVGKNKKTWIHYNFERREYSKYFVFNVINLTLAPQCNEKTRFSISIDFLCQYLFPDFRGIYTLRCILKLFHRLSDIVSLRESVDRKKIDHLTKVLKDIGVQESDIQAAFGSGGAPSGIVRTTDLSAVLIPHK